MASSSARGKDGDPVSPGGQPPPAPKINPTDGESLPSFESAARGRRASQRAFAPNLFDEWLNRFGDFFVFAL
jgi:hypothetical protein